MKAISGETETLAPGNLLAAVVLSGILVLTCCQRPLAAEDEVDHREPASPTAEDVTRLVENLNSTNFLEREKAARTLSESGSVAIPSLVRVAASEEGDVEIKQRALSILKKLAGDSNDSIVAELEKFADSEHPEEAEIAKTILRLCISSRTGEIPRDEFNIPGMDVNKGDDFLELRMEGGGMIRMGLKKGGGFSRSSINTGSGYAIVAGSNGKEEVVSAVGPEGDIWMLATREEDGELVERAYRYNNAGELKEKNPELDKLFQQFQTGRRPRGAADGVDLREKLVEEMRLKREEELKVRKLELERKALGRKAE